MTYTITTLAQCPELKEQVESMTVKNWPRFMIEAYVDERYRGHLPVAFPDFQLILLDEADTIVATGNTIPFVWDGTVENLPSGWDGVVVQGVEDHAHGRTPTALSALAATIEAQHRGKGLSRLILQGMKDLVVRHNLQALVAPVRPNFKWRYPLTPMEEYAQWTREDGAPFDPWLRVHWRMGARQIRLAPESVYVTGTVDEWEAWTKMSFPESGHYTVPEALEPVIIDREKNRGTYLETNVWMKHVIP